jgi:hypothetical protein
LTAPEESRSSTITWVEYSALGQQLVSELSVAPAVSHAYKPFALTVAAFGAKGGPGWQNVTAHALAGGCELASAGVASLKCSASPSGSLAGIANEQTAGYGQSTIGGSVVTGELFAVPTFTKVSIR